MDLNLAGRVAFITGPAKGMGAAITRSFAEEGCRLVLVGRDVAAIEPIAEEMKASGREAIVVRCDLTDAPQCDEAAKAAVSRFGRIDILVNVAGGSGPVGKSGVETTPEEFESAVFEPSAFFAVTRKRIVEPTSTETSAYVVVVAPETAEQFTAFSSQRTH